MELFEQLQWDSVQKYLEHYEQMGPAPGILLPMLESFLPILPLIAIIIANATAYGLWEGFLFSWLGTSIGSTIVFFLARKFEKKFAHHLYGRSSKVDRFLNWVDKKGFTPIFILSCLPFAPSSLVNIISGLSTISPKRFITAILLGKCVMVFTISFIGHNLQSFFTEPWKLATVFLFMLAFWMVGKKVEKQMFH